MDILRELIGLLLVVFAWLDPLSLGINFRVLLFILAFDLMNIFFKGLLFVADLFLSISGLGWLLVIFLGLEILIYIFQLKKIYSFILKPLVVFGIIYLNNMSWQLGVAVAGIDLLLNYSKKYI
jgi:hypothetical protein